MLFPRGEYDWNKATGTNLLRRCCLEMDEREPRSPPANSFSVFWVSQNGRICKFIPSLQGQAPTIHQNTYWMIRRLKYCQDTTTLQIQFQLAEKLESFVKVCISNYQLKSNIVPTQKAQIAGLPAIVPVHLVHSI